SLSYSPTLFYTTTSTPPLSTLSLHDALPISHTFTSADICLVCPSTLLLAQARRRPTGLKATLKSMAVSALRVRSSLPLAVSQSLDRKSTRLNSSHVAISYAVFCLKKKRK